MKYVLSLIIFLSSFSLMADDGKKLLEYATSYSIPQLTSENKKYMASAVVVANSDKSVLMMTALHNLSFHKYESYEAFNKENSVRVNDNKIRLHTFIPELDIALISFDSEDSAKYKPIPINDTIVDQYQEVHAMGHTGGYYGILLTSGRYQNHLLENPMKVITSARVERGSSGGALLTCDPDCKLIGITTSYLKDIEYMSVVTSIEILPILLQK